MNKSEFLKRLAALLHILEEDEVRDILDEYEQHIDMKVAEGMSEKEAIQAFGSVEELATEILSAYRVKADFKVKKENKVLGKMQDGSKKMLDNAGSAVKTAGNKTGSFVKRTWDGIKNVCKKPYVWIVGLKEKRKVSREQKEIAKMNKGEKTMSVKETTVGLGRSFMDFCKRCVRWLIRIMYGCIFACVGVVEIGLLIGAGMLMVLMLLGYPVIGLTISVMGAAMACFVITFYSAKKMRGRR